MSDWIRFEENKPITVTLKDTDAEKKDNNFNGYQYDWNIMPLSSGEIKFSASEALNEKMIALKLSAVDSISIEKVKKPEVFNGKPFFKVEMAQNQPIGADPVITESPVGVGFAQKDHKTAEGDLKAIAVDLHELSVRVEALEKEILKLKKDDDLPF